MPNDISLPYIKIRLNQLKIIGSFAQSRENIAQTIRLIEIGRLKLRKVIGGEFGLEECNKALELANEVRGWEKIVVLKP